MRAPDWLTARPVAHRGLHDAARGVIENMPGAVQAAIAGNFSIEVDIQLTADGEAMVGEIAVTSNLTRVWSRINQDVTVAYGTDIDEAIKVVDAVGREMASDPAWKRRVLETPRVDRVAALGEYGVTLKILGTVRATEQWAAAGELRKRLLVAFKVHGIEIPRPQRVVLAREGGAASGAPALGPTDEDLAPEE